jgi:Bardet-Biedl syndrome 2 protein
MWLNQSFVIDHPLDNQLDETFISSKDGKVVRIVMKSDGKIDIKTEDIEAAGDMIQDLCEFLQVEELESVAYFPDEMKKFTDALNKANEFNAVRVKLTTEMADSSNLIKTLVIKAEDARILNEMYVLVKRTLLLTDASGNMKKIYKTLFELNQNLVGEYTKRSNNYEGLLASLKDVNQMIQRSARLRVGSVKQSIITSCRAAIKANNLQTLFQIIKFGKE